MRSDSYISTVRTSIREGELSRYGALRLDAGRAFAVAAGVGLPRTWAPATRAVLESFELGFHEARSGEGGAERIVACAERARLGLSDFCESLIERELPDVAFAAASIIGDELHIAASGAIRAYLHRQGKPQRLTPRDEPDGGILSNPISHCSSSLEIADLVMLGSVSAFSMQAISRVIAVLASDPRTAPSVIAALLTEPASQAGVGAAAVVMRIE